MSNERKIRKTTLYKVNAFQNSEADGLSQNKIFKSVGSILREYLNYIKNSIDVVQKQGALKVKLEPREVKLEIANHLKEKKEEKELRFYLDLSGMKDKGVKRAESELFNREAKYVYSSIPSGDNKDGNIRIKVIDRNQDKQYLILDTENDKLKDIYLKANDYQLRMQKKAVLELMNQPLPEHQALLRLFDRERGRAYFEENYNDSIDVEDWKILFDENYDGTIEQRNFILKSLRTKDFAMLEGPPGSGKTTAIIELIIQLILQGKRVLLVSATHVAVDNVIHRILTSYEEQCEGKVVPIRIGTRGSIRKESVEPYRLEDFVSKTKQDIRNSIRNRQDQPSRKTLYNCLDSEKGDRVFDDVILNSANLVGGTMIGILQHPNIKKKGIRSLFDVMIVDESSKVTFLDFIVPALHAKKWIMVGDVKQLSPYIEDDFVSESIERLLTGKEGQKEKAKILQGFELHKKLDNAKPWEEDAMKILFSDYHTPADFPEGKELVSLSEKMQMNSENILRINSADILVCKDTAKCREMVSKYVYVKSMIFEAELNHPTFKNRQAFFNQYKGRNSKFHTPANRYEFSQREAEEWGQLVANKLSQVYQYRLAKDEESREKLRIREEMDYLVPENLDWEVEKIRRMAMPSILELLQVGIGKPKYGHPRMIHSGFSKFNRIKKNKFQSLSYQHRMNDGIAQIPRKYFYKGENLYTANTVNERKNHLESYKPNEDDVIWSFNNDRTFRKRSRKGRTQNINLTEVNDIRKELSDFLKFAKSNPKEEKGKILNYEIAVLSFYREQEVELRKMLRQFCKQYGEFKLFSIANIKITLCTVDKFQGDEADMVLLSFVKNTKGAFYNSPNRLNVALTRARYKLVLFGNKKLSKNAPSHAIRELATIFKSRLKYKNKKS